MRLLYLRYTGINSGATQRTVEMTMNPRVKAVVPNEDYRLILTFTNGEVGTFDCRDLLEFGVFREFQSIGYFLQATVVDGTVVWPNEQDICPDTLYEDSIREWPNNADQTMTVEPRVKSCANGESNHAAR